jgi:tetratricopeptide (TPR) repeat protein
VKRLVIGFVSVVLSATVVFAAPPATTPAQPAAGAPPPATNNAPATRYDWQGNHRKAQAALKAKDFKTAIIVFTEILESGRLPPSWKAPTLYMRGKAYRESRQYNLAVADYTAALEADPKMDPAWYELGATYQQLNQHAKAADAFGKAIALKNNNADYYYARCVSYSWLSNFKSAIADCEAATRLRPGDANMLGVLGRLYEDSGNKQKAIETYKKALAINPSQPEAVEGMKQLSK